MKRQVKELITRILVHKSLYSFYKFLYVIGLKGTGHCNYESTYVTGEEYIIRKLLNSGSPLIFDIGANDGQGSLLFTHYNSNAEVIALEPNTAVFNKLVKNVNGKVRCLNLAAGERATKLKLYNPQNNPTSEHTTLYSSVLTGIHHTASHASVVKVDTLDHIYKTLNLKKKIDLLKIDVEGHEMNVLKGAKNLIKQGKIKSIQFEFNSMNVYSRVYLKDFIELLRNFSLYIMLPDGVVPINQYDPMYHEVFSFHNIIAINNSCSDFLDKI